MAIYEKAENVKCREDFIEFKKLLRIDLQTNKRVPNEPSWKTIADILFASSMYEWYNYGFRNNKTSHIK